MSVSSPSDKVLADESDGIGRITFNNPRRHNAMSLEMWQALGDVLDQFSASASLRVLILAGAGGKAFVSGADISEFETRRSSAEQQEIYESAFDRAQDALAACKEPVIAMIGGYCVGGGLALALNADIRIASRNSKFAIPAAKLGLGYGYDSIKTLTSIVGPAFAKDILFSARMLEADEALRIGLVHRMVESGELDKVTQAYAERLVANAPLTIRAIKAAVNETVYDPGQASPEYVDKLVAACFESEDYKEGREAFMNKRKPVFKGR